MEGRELRAHGAGVLLTGEPSASGSPGSLQWSGGSHLSLRVRNQNGSGNGNDTAIDDTASGPYGQDVQEIDVLGNDRGTADHPLEASSVEFPTEGQPDGATVSNGGKSLTVPGEGVYTVNDNGTVTFTPEPGFSGTATPAHYRVTDTAGRTAEATITVTVPPAEDDDGDGDDSGDAGGDDSSGLPDTGGPSTLLVGLGLLLLGGGALLIRRSRGQD